MVHPPICAPTGLAIDLGVNYFNPQKLVSLSAVASNFRILISNIPNLNEKIE